MKRKPLVAAYYFPNWHCDPRVEELHGKGWTEWRVAQYATPRFPGHQQPKVPLWGYQDESEPDVMAQKISAAKAYGVNAFIWDWYWFSDGPYRHRALEEGFLKAPNCEDIKFAIMWANHNPIYAHPGSYWKPAEINWSGAVDPKTFRDCTDYCIKNFLGRPNYLRLSDGSLYFMLYRLGALVEEVGGLDTAAALIREFRDKVEKAGLGKLHISTVFEALPDVWRASNRRNTISPESITSSKPSPSTASPPTAGLQGRFPRNRLCKVGEKQPLYPACVQQVSQVCVQPQRSDRLGLLPAHGAVGHVRKPQLSVRPVVVNNTPERFQEELQFAKNILDSDESRGQMIKISCWNEWTEGAYLEPDTQYGYGFLQAVKNVSVRNEVENRHSLCDIEFCCRHIRGRIEKNGKRQIHS